MGTYWIFASAPVMGGTREGEVTFEATPQELADLEHKLNEMVEKDRLHEFDIREVIDGAVYIDSEWQTVNDGSVAEEDLGLTPGGVLKWAKSL